MIKLKGGTVSAIVDRSMEDIRELEVISAEIMKKSLNSKEVK